jgi:hypothetical protein
VETAHQERNLRRLGYVLGRERPAHLHRLDAARTSFTAGWQDADGDGGQLTTSVRPFSPRELFSVVARF